MVAVLVLAGLALALGLVTLVAFVLIQLLKAILDPWRRASFARSLDGCQRPLSATDDREFQRIVRTEWKSG